MAKVYEPLDTTFSRIMCFKISLEYTKSSKNLLQCFKLLSDIDMTEDLLRSTGIGITIQEMANTDDEIGEAAFDLVNKWKKMITEIYMEKQRLFEAEARADAEAEAEAETDSDAESEAESEVELQRNKRIRESHIADEEEIRDRKRIKYDCYDNERASTSPDSGNMSGDSCAEQVLPKYSPKSMANPLGRRPTRPMPVSSSRPVARTVFTPPTVQPVPPKTETIKTEKGNVDPNTNTNTNTNTKPKSKKHAPMMAKLLRAFKGKR